MKFLELTDNQLSDFITEDPKLIYIGLSDQSLEYIYKNGRYMPSSASNFIGITTDDDVLVCVLRWEQFDLQVISVHPYVSSKLHGKGTIYEVFEFVYKHFVDNTDVRKVISFITEPSIQAWKAVERCGFKREGYISNACTWRQEIVGMYIYGIDIIRNKTEE